ncbi:MAG: hypothetical protein AAGA99_00650 [Actinomycetota bacterium]
MAQLADDAGVNPFWPFTSLPVFYLDNSGRPFRAPAPDESLGQGSSWSPFNNGRHVDIGTATVLLTQAFGRPPTAYEIIGYTRANNLDIVGGDGQRITSLNALPASVDSNGQSFQISVPSTHPSQQPESRVGPGGTTITPDTPLPGNPADIPAESPEVIDAPDVAPVSTADSTIRELEATFSWVSEIGIDVRQIRDWIVTDGITNVASLVEKIRGTTQYKQRFPEIRRPDGTMRSDEGTYLRDEDSIRTVLRRFGDSQYDYQDPADVAGFIRDGIDASELEQRFTRFNELERSSQGVKDAFYIYTGREISTEDLYEIIIDPDAQQRLATEFNTQANSVDYQTWISRATEVGLRRVVTELESLQRSGATTAEVVQGVQRLDPEFARQITGALANSGPLQWDELVSAFEIAMIGGAASEQGFEIPDADRVERFRQAGVDRARALQAYGELGASGDLFNAAAQRAGLGGFSQQDFEDARLLFDGTAQARLENALGQEAAKGFETGSALLGRNESGRIVNEGLART